MTEILAIHKEHRPAFGFDDGSGVAAVCYVLAKGLIDDCAVYQGIIPDWSMRSAEERSRLYQMVGRGGNKLSEAEARKIFDIPEGLRYRK